MWEGVIHFYVLKILTIEYMNSDGQWFKACGNENGEFDQNGLIQKRFASINDLAINEEDRKFM